MLLEFNVEKFKLPEDNNSVLWSNSDFLQWCRISSSLCYYGCSFQGMKKVIKRVGKVSFFQEPRNIADIWLGKK